MKFSYAVYGGLGDFILRYLGYPGNRLASLLRAKSDIEFRIGCGYLNDPFPNKVGIDLFKNNPYFSDAIYFQEDPLKSSRLSNDIFYIENLKSFNKLIPPLWLDEKEENILQNLRGPYSIFHPFASSLDRSLAIAFNIHKMAQWIADISGIPLVVLGAEDFGYRSDNVFQIKNISARLAVRIVANSSFFVGTHSSMQCAAWVYKIPSFCIGFSSLIFHDTYTQESLDMYINPLFKHKNVFMLLDQSHKFVDFFDYFLKKSTSIRPIKQQWKFNNHLG